MIDVTEKQIVEKQELDFDTIQTIRQYKKIQGIGAVVFHRWLQLTGYDYKFERVDLPFDREDEVGIYHYGSWLVIPTAVFRQGADAIMNYLKTEHEVLLAERQKQQEAAKKDQQEQERRKDIAEYERLKKKLGITENLPLPPARPAIPTTVEQDTLQTMIREEIQKALGNIDTEKRNKHG